MMMTPLFAATERASGLFCCLFLNNYCLLRFFLNFGRPDFNYLGLIHFWFLNGNDFKLDLYLFHFFFLVQRGNDLSSNVDLHILLSFEKSLHDVDVFIAQDSDIIIILVEEGDV
jgi:hypothetical protein